MKELVDGVVRELPRDGRLVLVLVELVHRVHRVHVRRRRTRHGHDGEAARDGGDRRGKGEVKGWWWFWGGRGDEGGEGRGNGGRGHGRKASELCDGFCEENRDRVREPRGTCAAKHYPD
ncbi:hypothetical protein Drorol1_Dr00015051 [Drosera rotundifolia]